MSSNINSVNNTNFNHNVIKPKKQEKLFNVTDSFTPGGKEPETTDLRAAARDVFSKGNFCVDSLWTFEPKLGINTAPIASKSGSVFAIDYRGNIYALDGKNGDEKWTVSTGKESRAFALDEDSGTLYAGLEGGFLNAYDADTGKLKWDYRNSSDDSPREIILMDDSLILQCHDTVFVIDPATGKEQGKYKLEEKGSYYFILSKAVQGKDGSLITGGDTKNVFSVDPKTGKKLWEFDAGCKVSREKVAVGKDGTVFFSAKDNKFYALDGKTGKKKWDYQSKNQKDIERISAPVIGSDGTVFFRSSDQNLYALDPDTGKEKWIVDTGKDESSYTMAPLVDNKDNVYVGNTNGMVTVYNGKTGGLKGKFNAEDRLRYTPLGATDDGIVFVPSTEKLIAVGVRDTVKEIRGEQAKADDPNGTRFKIVEEDNQVTIGGVKLSKKKWNYLDWGSVLNNLKSQADE